MAPVCEGGGEGGVAKRHFIEAVGIKHAGRRNGIGRRGGWG